MIKLRKEEKNLINLALIISACFVLFLVVIYFPKSRALSKLKSKIEKNDALIEDMKKTIGENVSMEVGVGVLRKQASILSARYVDQKDIFLSLNRLSQAADSAGVRIISESPQNLGAFGSVKYNDKSCLKQPVRLVLYGRYEQLINYMYLLEQSPVGIFTIESFNIMKEKDIVPDLKMDLTVGLYVFGEAKPERKL